MHRILIITITLLVSAPLMAQNISPDDLWSAMLKGNKQFMAGSVSYTDLIQERDLLDEQQSPPITILSCSDSRVPPELIFNQSLGALFVIRTAGNVVDDFGLASVEFAIANGYTKLIIVLGHESCGAVKASLGGADPNTPAQTALAQRIRSSFVGVPYDSRDEKNVKKAVEANARASAAQLLAMSRLVRDAALTEAIKVVTAYYDLTTGEVTKLE
ncbi:MAG TPA: carbonic anhydrase [Thermoanaerobaculia bacterium]|nr:carbonic anhydrase [Thermoanaerobaculia bacterium]